jgi:hypothetical protein
MLSDVGFRTVPTTLLFDAGMSAGALVAPTKGSLDG